MASNACIDAVREAAKGVLSDSDLDDIFTKAQQIRKRIIAEGKLDDLDRRVFEAIEEEATRTKIAAAVQRRSAAIAAVKRDAYDEHVKTLMDQGLDKRAALLAVFEGTQKQVKLGRVSVYGQRQAYETQFLGAMVRDLEADAPHVHRLVDDKQLADDVVREMTKRGSTNNTDAAKVADIFLRHADNARVVQNRLGAHIGKLDGWGGPHKHSAYKIGKVGKDTWVANIAERLDLRRTFPDVHDPEETIKLLGDIYDNIIIGREGTPAQRGEIVGPANLAKSLSKSRVLHFKDADNWIKYNEDFGDGGIMSAMVSHQQRAASSAAQMSMLGTNPEVMVTAKVADMGLDHNWGLENAKAEMLGHTLSTHNIKAATINTDIRNVLSMAMLGRAVITAIPTDFITSALAPMFRGSGFLTGMTQQMGELFKGLTSREAKLQAYLLGEGFDGLIASVSSSRYTHDGLPGATTKLTESFFKWSGLTGVTDGARAAAARVVAAEMGARKGVAFDKLPDAYKSLLGRHGIEPKHWDAIRSTGAERITPDLMQGISDDVANTLGARNAAAARSELELSVARLVSDEVNFAVVETDAASRRFAMQGTQAGTLTGEAMRYVMQFKGFPIAFGQRVLGRAWFGLQGTDKMAAAVHMGTLMTMLTAAGYASMTAKDAMSGRWPPRDPSDPKVLTAAALQGGAMGLYGDFLFGKASRFGNSPLETAAGPGFSKASNLLSMAQQFARGDLKAARVLNETLRTTPFVNLWYAKPVLDTLFINSMREWASPGYRRRTERRIKKEYDQELIF